MGPRQYPSFSYSSEDGGSVASPHGVRNLSNCGTMASTTYLGRYLAHVSVVNERREVVRWVAPVRADLTSHCAIVRRPKAPQ